MPERALHGTIGPTATETPNKPAFVWSLTGRGDILSPASGPHQNVADAQDGLATA
jgi:hypothetical protein